MDFLTEVGEPLNCRKKKTTKNWIIVQSRWILSCSSPSSSVFSLPLPIFELFQESFEDNQSELVLTHNCTSVFLQQFSGSRSWVSVKEIQWSCQPLQVCLYDLSLIIWWPHLPRWFPPTHTSLPCQQTVSRWGPRLMAPSSRASTSQNWDSSQLRYGPSDLFSLNFIFKHLLLALKDEIPHLAPPFLTF